MPDEFKIGIIGTGVIGEVHAGAIAEIPGARLAAVAEPRSDIGQKFANDRGAVWYPDLTSLLATADVDLVTVATPSGLHADQAVQAAEAGKHIITEKPMAITVDAADRMIAASRSAGVTLAVIFQTRFSRDTIRLKRAIDAGLLGRPILGNALVHWRRTPEYYASSGGWRGTWKFDGGGALMNQSIHTIDLLQWFLGPVERISAETATLIRPIEAEDTANATLRFASGALGTIQGTTAADKDWPVRLEVIGSKGRALLTGGKLVDWHGERELDDAELLTPADLALTEGWEPNEPMGAGHRRQIAVILDAIRSGAEAPVPGSEARKAIQIITTIYKSAASGKAIEIREGS